MSLSQEQQLPAGAETGLSLFAMAWLEQWHAAGGSIQIGVDGKAWYGWAPYRRESDDGRPLHAHMQEYKSAHYDGTMRALCDMLDAVPGGREAVRQIAPLWA